MNDVAVVGCGAVGARVARQLRATSTVGALILHDAEPGRARQLARDLGLGDDAVAAEEPEAGDVVVLASPVRFHFAQAQRALERGASVVTLTDSVIETQLLLSLDAQARAQGASVVIGAGFAPGLSCVLARFAAADFDEVEEIHVAKVGTGGPACARQHHRALAGAALDWRDGAWVRRPGGSGRELLWFPGEVAARDCYRGALADALLLAPHFATTSRITARVAATRRDRLTAGLPMLLPPHPEGGRGAVRVELRGRRGTALEVVVLGAVDYPAVAAASVAATAAAWVVEGRVAPGAGGLAALADPGRFLRTVRERGLPLWAFDGRVRTAAPPR